MTLWRENARRIYWLRLVYMVEGRGDIYHILLTQIADGAASLMPTLLGGRPGRRIAPMANQRSFLKK
jgi:hypothetical protein